MYVLSGAWRKKSPECSPRYSVPGTNKLGKRSRGSIVAREMLVGPRIPSPGTYLD